MCSLWPQFIADGHRVEQDDGVEIRHLVYDGGDSFGSPCAGDVAIWRCRDLAVM